MIGFLIKHRNGYIGPRENVLYTSKKAADNALQHWPGVDGHVVEVMICELNERYTSTAPWEAKIDRPSNPD